MAKFSCPVLTTSFFVFVCGGGYIAILVLFWDELVKGSTLKINWFRSSNVSSVDNVDSTAEGLLSGWLLVGTVLTAAVTIITGFWGFISACRGGQCEILSYLVLCISTAIFNVSLLVAASVVVAAHCHESIDKCMASKERDYYIALFSIIAGTFVVIVMSLFGSWASCKDKCYCCGAEDRNYNVNSVRGRTNILPMSSTNVGYY